MKPFTLIFFFISFLQLFSNDWPYWLGPSRDGVSTENQWKNNLENLRWKSKVGIGFSSMVVADGRLFTIGHDGSKRNGQETVFCLDARSGKTIWSDQYPAPLIDYLHEG